MLRIQAMFRAVLLLLPLMAAAQGSAVHVHTMQDEGREMQVTGLWPNACAPRVKTWSRDFDGSIDVLLGNSDTHCTLVPHDFSLTLPSTDQFSPALPTAQVFPLRIFAEGDDGATQLVGFSLQGGHHANSRPDTGFWWPQGDQADSGNVLSLEAQDGALGVALLSHDDLSGAPVWYFGTGRIRGNIAHVQLTRMDDGSSPFFGIRTLPQPHPAQTADIEFTSSTQARVWLSRPAPGVDAGLELAQLDFARRSFSQISQPQQWLGEWLLASTSQAVDTASALPASLDFINSETVDERHTRLLDRSGKFALVCEHTGSVTESAAQRCRLRDATGITRVTFEQVGLNRLDGRDSQGRAAVLLRPHE